MNTPHADKPQATENVLVAGGNDALNAVVRADTSLAGKLFWALAIVAALIAILGPITLLARRQADEPVGLIAIAAVMIVLVAALIYLLGWSLRWLYTRRTDHVFGPATYSAEGLEPARKKYARVFSVIGLFDAT